MYILIVKKLGAIHFVYNNKKATEEAVKNFRKFYTENPYILICDNGENHSDLKKTYNCTYIHRNVRLGYPNNNYGYSMEGILEYLKRIYVACILSDCSHLILMEDDVLIINHIQYNENDEMLATNQSDSFFNGKNGNIIHQNIMSYMPNNENLNNWYAAGGGCIFKVSTFLENYFNFVNFYKINFHFLQKNIQSIIGWPDFTLNLLYLFSGKKNTINTRLYEYRKDENYEFFDKVNDYDILHHYKKYYNL